MGIVLDMSFFRQLERVTPDYPSRGRRFRRAPSSTSRNTKRCSLKAVHRVIGRSSSHLPFVRCDATCVTRHRRLGGANMMNVRWNGSFGRGRVPRGRVQGRVGGERGTVVRGHRIDVTCHQTSRWCGTNVRWHGTSRRSCRTCVRWHGRSFSDAVAKGEHVLGPGRRRPVFRDSDFTKRPHRFTSRSAGARLLTFPIASSNRRPVDADRDLPIPSCANLWLRMTDGPPTAPTIKLDSRRPAVIINGLVITAAPSVPELYAVLGQPSRVVSASGPAPPGHRNNHIHVYDQRAHAAQLGTGPSSPRRPLLSHFCESLPVVQESSVKIGIPQPEDRLTK